MTRQQLCFYPPRTMWTCEDETEETPRQKVCACMHTDTLSHDHTHTHTHTHTHSQSHTLTHRNRSTFTKRHCAKIMFSCMKTKQKVKSKRHEQKHFWHEPPTKIIRTLFWKDWIKPATCIHLMYSTVRLIQRTLELSSMQNSPSHSSSISFFFSFFFPMEKQKKGERNKRCTWKKTNKQKKKKQQYTAIDLHI